MFLMTSFFTGSFCSRVVCWSTAGAIYEGMNELEIGDIPLLSKEGPGVVTKDAKRPYR
jgi:hypothetical protein